MKITRKDGWVLIDSYFMGRRMDTIRQADYVWDCPRNGMHVRVIITDNVAWWQQQVREQAARKLTLGKSQSHTGWAG